MLNCDGQTLHVGWKYRQTWWLKERRKSSVKSIFSWFCDTLYWWWQRVFAFPGSCLILDYSRIDISKKVSTFIPFSLSIIKNSLLLRNHEQWAYQTLRCYINYFLTTLYKTSAWWKLSNLELTTYNFFKKESYLKTKRMKKESQRAFETSK